MEKKYVLQWGEDGRWHVLGYRGSDPTIETYTLEEAYRLCDKRNGVTPNNPRQKND